MFENIKGILVIIILCILLIVFSKITYLLKYFIRNKSISVMEEIKELDYENFYYLSLESLSRRGFEEFSIVNDGMLRCTKDNEEYIIILDNGENKLRYKEAEAFYGYMVAYGIKKILFFMVDEVPNEVKEFFKDIDVELIYYGKEYIMEDYNSIIKHI
ncbi:MAG: hypothetical protein Q4B63_04295 [Clostridium perfringens]|nr:hypothetical protein [Clostridium perfringens]